MRLPNHFGIKSNIVRWFQCVWTRLIVSVQFFKFWSAHIVTSSVWAVDFFLWVSNLDINFRIFFSKKLHLIIFFFPKKLYFFLHFFFITLIQISFDTIHFPFPYHFHWARFLFISSFFTEQYSCFFHYFQTMHGWLMKIL